ncbi:MAG: transglycosylase SLT domain-containing protein [Pseudomonadota bacterium]
MKKIAFLATLFSMITTVAGAKPNVCEQHIYRASQKYAVPVALLYAVGLAESGRKGKLHPFALNVEGRAFFPKSRGEALKIFKREMSSGRRLIDLGCMQINHKYHASEFPSLEAMLNPKLNVDYSARFLRRLKDRHGTWSVAVARYHAGDKNHAAQKKYVCRVLQHMVSQNFATNTTSSNSVCKSTH